jgi:hypothetical protein
MNVSEAKMILRSYRPGTSDADDPQTAEALAVAKTDPELSLWLETHSATQEALRAKFKQIVPPAGLKEQIISEYAASKRPVSKRPRMHFIVAALALLLLGALSIFWFTRQEPENTLAFYQKEMVSEAERGYSMDLVTNDPAVIHAFLAQKYAPDFILPGALQKAALLGCTVEDWQGVKVSLICFRTGKSLQPGTAPDLWLFVVDRAAVKDAPDTAASQIAKISRLITATWTHGNKLYFLGVEGQEQDLKQYL